jgi:hypothetical protein
MAGRFAESGVRFRYPENWRLEREETDTGWTVSVQSPGTAFFMVCYRDDRPTPQEMLGAALEALRDDYPDLEVEDCLDSLAGQPATGHIIRFFSLDLTNTCWTRSFYGSDGTILVLWQVNDLELDTTEAVLRAICTSLQVDE